jgi:hypothetical protein
LLRGYRIFLNAVTLHCCTYTTHIPSVDLIKITFWSQILFSIIVLKNIFWSIYCSLLNTMTMHIKFWTTTALQCIKT